MFEKNPYENEDEFEEKEDEGIDMSAFNLADNNSNENDFEFDEEEDEEYEETKPNYRGVVILGIVLIVVLLIVAIAGWIFGVSKNNAYTKLMSEYVAIETKLTDANKNLEDLQNEYNTLKAALENKEDEGTSSDGEGEAAAADTYYVMQADVAVRKGAGTSYDFVNFDKLPAEIQDAVYSNESEVRTRESAKVPVYETKKDSDSNLWGRIADGAWVCLTYQGQNWGTKK